MKKLILTSIAFIAVLIVLKGQTKQSEVISAAGGTATLGTNTIDWTLGEVITGTISSTQTTLTQGFQQSSILEITTAIDLPNVEVLVYPNPTAHFLQVSTKNLPFAEFHLINLQGHRLIDKLIPESDQTIIDMSNYSEGIYMLEIVDQRSGQKEVIKVLKK